MRKRNILIGDRERGDFGDQECGDEIGDFKLADLAFSHQSHDKNQDDIYDESAD